MLDVGPRRPAAAAARDAHGWDVDVAEVARIWRGGCIIRARLLERMRQEYAANRPVTLLEAPSVAAEPATTQDAWRRIVAAAVTAGVPVPGFSAALAYRRVDREGSFHTLWPGDRSKIEV